MKKINLKPKEILKRLIGYPIGYKDMNGIELKLGDFVKIYYNIFDEKMSKESRSFVKGIIEYNHYVKKYYIRIFDTIIIGSKDHIKILDIENIFLANSKEFLSYDTIDSERFIEKINSNIDNDYCICSSLLIQKNECSFYKKVINLYKKGKICFLKKEIS